MTLNTTPAAGATTTRDGDETTTHNTRHCGTKLTNSRLHNNYNNNQQHYNYSHSQRHSLNLAPTRRSIFLEEGGGEGVEHQLGGEHDFVDLSASPNEDFSSYQHFDDQHSLMIMTHTSQPLTHSSSSCMNDSSVSSTNNIIKNSNRSNTSNSTSNTASIGSAHKSNALNGGAGGGYHDSPLVSNLGHFREATNTTRGAGGGSFLKWQKGKHGHQQKAQEQLQKKESERHHRCEDVETAANNSANGGSNNSSSCLVQTGDHTYRIPDGEKCTVKVGDKIRIIHGPAILNFASSDGLMTSVTGGDVPKLSKFRSSEITSLHLCPSDTNTDLNISASLASSPNRSDDDGSGRHSEDQSNLEDCKSRDEMIGYESPTKVGKMGDCFRSNSCRKLFQNGNFGGEHQTSEFGNLCNSCVHNGSSDSRKHINNSINKSTHNAGRLQCFETGPNDGGASSLLTAERDGDSELSRMLHVDIEMSADLSVESATDIKSSNSRHVSPCSEKSHDSSYSSSSCGSSKSPDVLSPVNQNRVAVNKRTKRKVKLVPYQDTNGAEYMDKMKWALSSVGTPRVTDMQTCSAKVVWSVCNKNLFPGGGQSSSSNHITHKICYNLSYGKQQIENKCTINCGSQTEYTLTSLSPGQCYELFVWANVDDIQGNNSPTVTFSTKNSPPERPNAPVLKSASKNSLVVAWQPPPSNNQNGVAKNIVYKLFVAEESQNLDLTGNVVRAVAAGSGATKHGATSSSSLKRRGNNSFEYESHLRYEGCQRSAKIDHLNPNTSYKFQLIVSNSEGCSEPSAEVVFTTLSVQPPQPDPPNLVYRDTYNIRLNWKSYLNKHSTLLGKLVPEFTLQMEDQKKLHGFVTQYSGPETCYTVANLPRSSKFRFKLFVEIGCLKSAASDTVVFSTRDCVPHAPTGLNCTDITSNKCTLRWEKPTDDGGSEVGQYIVERSISGGLFQEIYHGVDTCLPISSLFPGMEYHFRVAAENSVGRGMFSTSCPCHTKPVVPAQCSHPNVSGRIKPHSVHIAWSPPDYDGGSRILQYAVKQITDLSKPSDGFEISRDARRDLIVFQLSPGTVYGFSVCAINSVGRGPWSVPLEVQTAPDKPPAPEPPRVVFSPKSCSSTYARITWCPPTFDNGSPITEYRLEGCEDISIIDADIASLGGHLEPFSVAAGCAAIGGASMSEHLMETHYAMSSCSTSVSGAGGSASLTSSMSKHVQQQQHSSSYSSSANSSNRHSHSSSSSSHHHHNSHQHHHHLGTGPHQPLAAGVPASIPSSKRNSFNNKSYHHHESSTCNNNISGSSSENEHHHRSVNGGSGSGGHHPNGHTPLSMLVRKSNSHSQSANPAAASNVAAVSASVAAPAPSWFQLYRGVKVSFDYKSIKPATAYKFRVQAVNSIGASAYSNETFIMSPCSAPSAVTNVSHEATVDSIQLSWDVPECNGAPILSYYIDLSSPTTQVTSSSTSSTSRSSKHHNSASATAVSTSSYETVSSSSTRGSTNTNNNNNSLFTSSLQHNQLQVEQSSSSSTLSASANQNRSSSPNISFQRRTSNDDKTWQPHSFYQCDSNSYVINNLRADTLYKIRVRACNENGNGQFSVTVKVQTLCLPPEPPLLECVSSTASSLRLRWGDAIASSSAASAAVSASAVGSGSSSSKEVTYHLQMEDKSGRFQNTYSGSAVSYRVIRLQELTSYTFRINASNEAGHGPFSQLYCFSTSKSPPSPPMKAPRVKVVKDPSAGFVEVSWMTANPCADDKVLYQLMIATGPSFNDFVLAYKGSETNCRIENLLKTLCGRSQNQGSGAGHNDYRLKLCAIRQCQDDKQEIFGQYSPLCSFQYSPFINSNYNQNHHNHNNHYLSNHASSSSSSAHHTHNQTSYRSGNNPASSYNALHSTSENSNSSKQSHMQYDSSSTIVETSEGVIRRRGLSLSNSRLGCVVKSKVLELKKMLTEFNPNDTQIAVMVLFVFIGVLFALAFFIQQTFTTI